MKLRALLCAALLVPVGCAPAPERTEEVASAPHPLAAEAALAAVEGPRRGPDSDPALAGWGENAARYSLLRLDELMQETATPGFGLAVVYDYRVAWTHHHGVADLETGRPVDAKTLFQAASISKPVGAAAVLKAVESGLFDLDTPINDILRRWRLPDNAFTEREPVTPRRLLSHTAGTTVPGFPGYDPRGAVPDVVQVLEGAGPANTPEVHVDMYPGSERYSGGGITILQVALADAAERPYREVLREWVLEPAGMEDSDFDQPIVGERAARAARAHHRPDSPVLDAALTRVAVELPHAVRGQAPWHVYPELQAAGLWTTATDLARFGIDIARSLRGDGDAVLSPATARTMTTPVAPTAEGLGFRMQDRGTGQEPVWYYSHSGGNWGFRSYLMMHRDHGYGLAVMINGGDFEFITEIVRRVAEAWRWEGNLVDLPRNW